MRPIHHTRHQPMFDRVEMEIIQMAPQIIFIPHGVLPESPLPDAPLTLLRPTGTNALHRRQCPRKSGLDPPPAVGIIRIALRQLPHRMQMIGQHYQAQIDKGSTFPFIPECSFQMLDALHQQIEMPVGDGHGEKERPTRHTVATLVGHCVGSGRDVGSCESLMGCASLHPSYRVPRGRGWWAQRTQAKSQRVKGASHGPPRTQRT